MKILPTILLVCCTLIAQGMDLTIAPVPGAEINLYVEKTGLLSGKSHRFTFDRFSGRVSGVEFVQFQIESASIVCRDEWVNEKDRAKILKVALEDMLAAKKYPTIAFRSTKISDAGGGKWTVAGMLTIRDVTKPVEIRLDRRASNVFAGEAQIRLTDYGLKPPSAVLGAIGTKNEMRLTFTLPLTPAGDPAR